MTSAANLLGSKSRINCSVIRICVGIKCRELNINGMSERVLLQLELFPLDNTTCHRTGISNWFGNGNKASYEPSHVKMALRLYLDSNQAGISIHSLPIVIGWADQKGVGIVQKREGVFIRTGVFIRGKTVCWFWDT